MIDISLNEGVTKESRVPKRTKKQRDIEKGLKKINSGTVLDIKKELRYNFTGGEIAGCCKKSPNIEPAGLKNNRTVWRYKGGD